MPRPRFEKLPPEKREQILETAAKEFAEYGYEGASLNQILAKAGISKGAAYYYFDDKADLYMTTLTHYATEFMSGLDINFADITAVSFWPTLQKIYEKQFSQFAERPWVFGVVKSSGPLNLQLLTQSPLAEFWQDIESVMGNLFKQGIALGVVRSDLAEDLLTNLVLALDDTHDKWLLNHLPQMSPAQLQAAAAQMVDLLHRLLAP